jgi:NADH-quinone oxidoreductase subunit L
VLIPLFAGLIAGIYGKQVGKQGAHWVTCTGVAISFALSLVICKWIFLDNMSLFNGNIYTWSISGKFQFNIGFLIDHLSAAMMAIVTFVSLAVHVYSIGYMRDDPGYQRFFSYISFFTFAMLMLVTANNFLQLYFGWEGVGLISYLLIGFWFHKESANLGSLKAFIVNRIGDMGFLLALAGFVCFTNSLNMATIFSQAPELALQNFSIFPGTTCSVASLLCVLAFIGAMGKSAQMPLHVWLPESMEGPTPISALIHAATMVTAGIYLVSRMSPLFEYSPTALSLVLIVGATGALFTGILALVQNDIKRVVAYSTLSQLGYMVAALGASAYAAGIFHLITHAFFKALLFLAAGSVILACHHEQDMRKMGGLYKYLPITYITFLIGALALCAVPPFSGFYSKDAIIEALSITTIFGGKYAYFCVLIGAFVTSLYTFRAFFMTFHTQERMDEKTRSHLHESPMVILVPLIVLAIPSIFAGMILAKPFLYQLPNILGNSIFVLPNHDVLAQLSAHFKGHLLLIMQSFHSLTLWLALAGIFVAWLCYECIPDLPTKLVERNKILYKILVNKYGFDKFNEHVIVRRTRELSDFSFHIADVKILDGLIVNGAGRAVTWFSSVVRRLQSGYLFHYTLVMIVGLLGLLFWLILG